MLLIQFHYKRKVSLCLYKFLFFIFIFIFSHLSSTVQASTDQSAVDLIISSQLGSFAFSMIQLLGIIAVMSVVAWQVFIIFIPVAAACIWYQVLKWLYIESFVSVGSL